MISFKLGLIWLPLSSYVKKPCCGPSMSFREGLFLPMKAEKQGMGF